LAEIEFRSQEDVERWLKERPRADALVLAARAALRVVPMLRWPGQQVTKRSAADWNAGMLLPFLRSTASPWLDARYPNQGGGGHAAASYASYVLAADANVFSAPTSIFHASNAALYAANAVVPNSVYYADAADAAGAAADAADFFDAADAAAAAADFFGAAPAWKAATLDARALAGGDGVVQLSPAQLASAPLWSRAEWPEGGPDWARRAVLEFQNYLIGLQNNDPNEHWDVWEDWYSARLNGGNAFGLNDTAAEQVETGILLLRKKVWKQGPKMVNRAIKALIDKARAGETALDEDGLPPESAIPPQDQRGVSFGGEADEPISLAPMEAPDRLRATPERQEDYDDIREKAEAIKAEGVNRVSHLMGPLDRLLSLSANLSGVRAQPFWSRVNTLRIKLNGHTAAIEEEKKTGEKDERRLDSVVADLLADLVETINAFHLGDPKLVEFDAARPGPKDIAQIKAEFAPILAVLSEVADKPEIVAADASEVLKDSIEEAARSGESLAERQAIEASSRTLRNFVTTLLSRVYRPIKKFGGAVKGEAGVAWKEYRGGYYKDMGAAAAKLTRYGVVVFFSAKFIASNKAALIAYVTAAFPNAPALIQIIQAIAQALGI
jgi:hypothetical protein